MCTLISGFSASPRQLRAQPQARIDELAQQATSSLQASPSFRSDGSISRYLVAAPVPIALRVIGLLSWERQVCRCASVLYQGLARVVLATAVAAFFLSFVASEDLLGVLANARCRTRTGSQNSVCFPEGDRAEHI